MVDKLESIAEIEASFDRARAYLRSEGWPDDHGAIGYMAVTALLAGYERRSATPANGEQVERAYIAGFEQGWECFDSDGNPGEEAERYAAGYVAATPTEDARERVTVLEEALEPFALAADDLDDKHGDHSSIWEAPAAMSIDAGDLRRARTALGNKETDRHG